MSRGQDFHLPHLRAGQALGAGVAAGALALYIWTKGRTSYAASTSDTPQVGIETDEIILYGILSLSPSSLHSKFNMCSMFHADGPAWYHVWTSMSQMLALLHHHAYSNFFIYLTDTSFLAQALRGYLMSLPPSPPTLLRWRPG